MRKAKRPSIRFYPNNKACQQIARLCLLLNKSDRDVVNQAIDLLDQHLLAELNKLKLEKENVDSTGSVESSEK